MQLSTRNSVSLLCTLALLLGSPRLQAESDTPNFYAGLPPAADITPAPPPPPPPQQDRKDGSGAAVAMAIVGAAMAGASCAMLMRQAAQEPDPSKAAMLRAMAMQQCAQAAQNAANAAQNNDGKEQLQQSDGNPQQQLDALPTLAKEDKNDAKVPSLGESSEEPSDESQIADADNFIEPDFSALDQFPTTDQFAGGGDDPSIGGGFGGGVTTLDPIDKARVKYDDASKGSNPTPEVPLGASTTQYSFAGGAPGSGPQPELEETEGEGADGKGRRRRNRQLDELLSLASGEGSSDSPASGGQEEDFDLNGMMSKLLGKGPADGVEAGGGGGPGQIVQFRAGADGKNAPNIFEYGSYRYRQAEKDGLVVRPARRKPTGRVAGAKPRTSPVKVATKQ